MDFLKTTWDILVEDVNASSLDAIRAVSEKYPTVSFVITAINKDLDNLPEIIAVREGLSSADRIHIRNAYEELLDAFSPSLPSDYKSVAVVPYSMIDRKWLQENFHFYVYDGQLQEAIFI